MRGQKMPKHPHADAMDAIVKDIFRHGGPQRPSYPNGSRGCPFEEKEKPATHYPPKRKHKPCPALLKEQRRLVRSWKK